MKHNPSKHLRLLAIAPSTRGFGFAILEGKEMLVNWGIKTVKGDKNARSLAQMAKLLAHYQPDVVVLQDMSPKDSRRSARIRELAEEMIALAATHKIKVKLFSREQVMRFFFEDSDGTKHALAEILARKFPEELGSRLPPKRLYWMNEDSRMDIFEAVALGLVLWLQNAKRTNDFIALELE